MSNSNKFTPGPWTLSYDYAGGVRVRATEIVAQVYGHKQDNPDARLIAAAPDGLEIALFLKKYIDEGAHQVSFSALATDDDETTLADVIEAYITKATGGAE